MQNIEQSSSDRNRYLFMYMYDFSCFLRLAGASSSRDGMLHSTLGTRAVYSIPNAVYRKKLHKKHFFNALSLVLEEEKHT